MDKVVNCLDRQLPNIDPEVTLHQYVFSGLLSHIVTQNGTDR